jgi:hypothetical protein
MKTVEIDNEKIIKSISKLSLDKYNPEEEEKKTSFYINSLRKEQEKCKNNREKYERYEKEINDKKDDLEYKNRVYHEQEKPTVDEKVMERLQKLHSLNDIINDYICPLFKIEATYEVVESRFLNIFKGVIPPQITWNDDYVIKYNKKSHKEFLEQRIKKGDSGKAWETLIDHHCKSLKRDDFVIVLIPPTSFDNPVYIKDNDMIYSLYQFPLFNGAQGQEDDRFINCITSLFSKKFNDCYYINTLTYSWKIDENYKYAILYLVFENKPKI